MGIYFPGPRRRPFHRPLCQPIGAFICSPPQTAPGPVLRSTDERCSESISFDVSAHDQKVPITLDRNRREPPLIHCAFTHRAPCAMPETRVSGRQAMHEHGKRARGSRRCDKMPVIWHEAVRKDGDARMVQQYGFFQHAFEGLIVGRGVKEPSALRCAVQDVVDVSVHLIPPSTGHAVPSAIAVPPVPDRRVPSAPMTPDPNVLCR